MSIEDNKDVVRRLFAAQQAADIAAIDALLSDDLAWRYMGDGSHDVTKTKPEMLAMQARLLDGWIESWSKEITGITAEGDYVAVEAENRIRMKDGRLYEQRYHYLHVVRDGKIVAVREYMDTDHARRFFENAFP